MSGFMKYKHYIWGVTASIVGVCVQILPHTVFLEKYRYCYVRRRFSTEISLSEDVMQRYIEVVNDLKLSENIKNAIKPFNTSGYNVFYAGTIHLKYGAILGIPSTFEYAFSTDLEKKYMKINDQDIDWSKEEALDLVNSLILSKDAQKFAIAREILRLQDEEILWTSIAMPPILISMHPAYDLISSQFKLHTVNPYRRWAVIGAIMVFGVTLCMVWADYLSYKHDVKNDAMLANLGPEYIKGGQEYYAKLLQRNMALRSLMGDVGTQAYTASGNERTLFRLPYKSLTQKKTFFDRNLEALGQPA